MIRMSLAEIAQAVGGRLHALPHGVDPRSSVDGAVQTDSREITPGGIFFAKRGEVTDGHLFAAAAARQGAALLIVEHPVEVALPQILVSDTVVALGALAHRVVEAVRSRGRLKVVAVTGSNGKTTTKNLLAQILARTGTVVAPQASFNNSVGAPLTALRITEDTDFLVAEMGASHIGDISRLVAMEHPDVGIVLKVGMAHAGEFGGIEQTQKAKSEMVTDLTPADVAVLNADDPRVAAMADLTRASVRWFGRDSAAQTRAVDVTSGIDGSRFTLDLSDGRRAPVHLHVLGEHHVMNAVAAAAACDALGTPLDDIVAGIQSITRAERWRMEVLGGGRGVTIINDAYNASPESMAAALKTLARVTPPEGRSVAVLGMMNELGEYSDEEHDRIGLLAVRLGIDKV
ncbi:MAG TPA: UDP-N-acetylmuramoyl-tripeptide--D-alanyl-D-alanine ligase, partial [Microbacteriaceae bacterium]|nr:UDP-N-acetylmuramoyl-tripeptide--D-alanyl-D-alanine ligase [Microbacteriaceae bacterium]